MLKFKPMHLDFMYSYAQELIQKFGYQDLFQTKPSNDAVDSSLMVPVHLQEFTTPIGNDGNLRAFNE